MGLYARLYPQVANQVLELATVRIHGSKVRDLFVEYANGRFFVDNHAEALLTEFVEEGLLVYEGPDPTTSQRAFIGLQYDTKSYRQAGWAPGIREHYWYQRPLGT